MSNMYGFVSFMYLWLKAVVLCVIKKLTTVEDDGDNAKKWY